MLPYSKYSFPSGHTAMSFLFAVVLSDMYPKYMYLFYTIAVLTALSRLYLGVHYLSDVVGGALIGITIGVLAIKNKKLINKLEEKVIKHLSIF